MATSWTLGSPFSGAVPVQPCRGAAFGVLLVDGLALVVEFENVGEDGEADLRL
jgi:hypothetical protein